MGPEQNAATETVVLSTVVASWAVLIGRRFETKAGGPTTGFTIASKGRKHTVLHKVSKDSNTPYSIIPGVARKRKIRPVNVVSTALGGALRIVFRGGTAGALAG